MPQKELSNDFIHALKDRDPDFEAYDRETGDYAPGNFAVVPLTEIPSVIIIPCQSVTLNA